MSIHASVETTKTWDSFNNGGTKMSLLSDELWLIANNYKSFANRSKPIMRSNLRFVQALRNLPYLELSKILLRILRIIKDCQGLLLLMIVKER